MENLNLLKSSKKYTAIRWTGENIENIKSFIKDTNINIDSDFFNPKDTHLSLVVDNFRHIQVPKNQFIIFQCNNNRYYDFSSIRRINKEFTRS